MNPAGELTPTAKQSSSASKVVYSASPLIRPSSPSKDGILAYNSRGLDTSGTTSLPNLRQNKETSDSGAITAASSSNLGSPMRKARKAELMAYAMGHNPNTVGNNSSSGLLLDLEKTQQQLVTVASQQEDLGRLALETWVDDVLKTSRPPSAAKQQQQALGKLQQIAESAGAKGAAAAGLARQQLLATGMSNAAVDQLYRGLFVYSVGFFDTIKEVLEHNSHKQELLYTIWKTFLTLAEHAMKATFKSEYLSLVEAAGTAMAELMSSKHALAEARRDNAVMVKDLGWLASAEAEASTARRGLRSQVDELQTGLSTEQKAHQHAVKQYVDALDAKSALQLQLQDTQQQYNQLRAEHDQLLEQHQHLQGNYQNLVGQCRVVRDVFKQVDDSLALDPQLAQSMQGQQPVKQQSHAADTPANDTPSNSSELSLSGSGHQKQQKTEQPDATADAPQGSQPSGTAADATDMQPLAERLHQQVEIMYFQWRLALEAKAVALTENYKMSDELRAARDEMYRLGQQLQAVERSHTRVEKELNLSQAHAADLEKRLLAAHEAAAKHLMDLGETQTLLQQTQDKAASLDQRCAELGDKVRDLHDEMAYQARERTRLEQQVQTSGERLVRKHRLMAEVSKGLSIAIRSLWAQQTGRNVLKRLLDAERQKGAHLGSSLEGKDARLHDLDATVQEQQGRIARFQSEVALLESALADSQKQAMSLNAKLSLSDSKNEELMNQIQDLQDQIKDTTTRLNRTTTKLEVTQGQLDKAHREIKDLKEAAQVAERQLADAQLSIKSLTADIERLTREKKDQHDRAEATKARLQLDVQRLSGELHAAQHKSELLSTDLAGERDRVSSTQALLERKRGKKRRWKEAYGSVCSEVESLHKQLLSKQKELDALDARIKRLETELRLLGAATTVRLLASATGKTSARPVSAHAVSVVDLAVARKAHEDAATDVGSLGQECLELDGKVEVVELAQQQLLLKLAAPDITEDQIASTKAATAAKLTELRQLRSQRDQLEAKRGEAAARMRAAEAALREAHQQRLVQRQRLLEQSALQASDLANATALGQLAAAEAAEVASREQLSKQLAAFEAAQADKAAMSLRVDQLQGGIEQFHSRITGLQGDKAQLEERLQRASTTLNFLQVEISTLKTERERIKLLASDSEARITALEKELEQAKQSVSVALKGLEAKHQADKLIQEQKQLTDRAKAAQAAKAQEAVVTAVKTRCYQLQEALQFMLAEAWALKTGTRQPSKGYGGTMGNPAGSGDQARSRHGSKTGSVEQADGSSSGASNKAVSIALSDYGAGGGGDGTVGVRWLYLHQQSGPWVTVRAVLKEAAAAGGASTSRSEGGGNGVRHLGGPTALPCSLPGLSLNPDSLAILIGELILDKIASDSYADAYSAAAATGCNSKDGSAVFSEDGAKAKGAAAVKAWWTARNRKDLEGSVYDFFMTKLGCHLAAEAHCSALVRSLRRLALRSKRARLFGRCLGVIDPAIPAAGVGTLIHLMAQLHSLCGPITTEATEGSSQVVARTAVQVVAELLQPTLATACPTLQDLPAAIIQTAGGHSDNSIEVDDLLELVLAAWQAQQAADERQIRMLFGVVDVRQTGLILLEEFDAVLAQLNSGAAAAVSQEQLGALFTSALHATGPAATAVSASGCAAAFLGAGLLGCGAHLRAHPVITKRPPFREYRMLEESWRAVKPAMQDLLRSLPKRLPQLTSEVSTMTAQVKKLDDNLEACMPAAEVWQLYRQLLAFYSHHGKFVDMTPTAASAGCASPRSLMSAGADGGSGSPLSSPRGFVAAGDTATGSASMSGIGFGGFDSTAGSLMGGFNTVLSLDANSRPGSPAVEQLPSIPGSTGLEGGRPLSPRLAAVSSVGVRSGSPSVATATASSTGAASPAGSRPGSAGVPGLKLPLVVGIVKIGSALAGAARSPRASGKLSRPASAAAPK